MAHPDTQPVAYTSQTRPRTSAWAVASLVLGLIAAALFAVTGFYGFFALLAVIAGHSGRHQIKRGLHDGNGFAVTGLILGYLVLAISFIATVTG